MVVTTTVGGRMEHRAMFRAVYADGVLRPESPLDLPDGSELTLIVTPRPDVSLARLTSGMVTLSAPEEVSREIMEASIFDDHHEEAAE